MSGHLCERTVDIMMRDGFFAFGRLCRHMGFGGGFFMMIGGLLLLGLVIYVIVVLTGNKPANQHVTGGTSLHDIGSAMNILNERFARGEINQEEYAGKKSELRK